MNLYHGTVIGGLDVILANATSHKNGGKVAYFTTDRIYALVCCRPREENFVTMGLRKDGKQHYFERFPDQLKILYEGKAGFIYSPISEANLENTKDHTWECGDDVPVMLHEHVLNVYDEIIKEEKAGNVIIHRYEDIDSEERKMHISAIREHYYESESNFGLYRDFIYKNFSSIWD